MPGRIIISVTNDITTDQRVIKTAEVLRESGNEILIVGRSLPGSLPADILPFETVRFRMLYKTGFLFYMFYNIRLFFFLLFKRACLLVSNDLDTVLPNLIVSKLKGIKLVFDSHEYFTAVPDLADRHFVRKVWKLIERIVFPRLDIIITVNNSLAGIYYNEYGKEVFVVRNVSKSYNGDKIPRKEIVEDGIKLLLVYQGSGLNKERGGEELIDAVINTDDVHLIIIGSGNNIDNLKNKIDSSGASEKFTFLPVMPWCKMMAYTSAADVGVSLDKADYINSKYSLPNKIFDYINAGIAVLSSDLPEIKSIIEEFKCGVLIKSVDQRSISESICLLRDRPDLLMELRQNSVRASEKLNWEYEKEKVRDIYRKTGLVF